MEKKLQDLKSKQDQIFIKMAQMLGSLSAPVRIKLIHFLSQAPLTVEVLSGKTDQSVANTSMHLRKMLHENIVRCENIGQKRLYSLHPTMFEFWEHIQNLIETLDPSLKMNADENLNWPHTSEETLKMARKDEILLIDLRPEDEVITELLPFRNNYLHMPLEELKGNLKRLPKRKDIVVMCRGRMCALSLYAVNFLREHQFKAYRFEESWFALNQTYTSRMIV